MISVRNLIKDHGPLRVLNGVSLAVRKGEVAAVIGPSGGGKSTLLRCINGLDVFQEGEVQVGDVTLRAGEGSQDPATLRTLRRRAGMVFQQFHLFPHMNVLENVLAGPLFVLNEPREAAQPKARQLLERVGLAEKLAAMPDQLSGGQQQRVAIARALAMQPEVILFDEPTSALDPRMAAEVISVITDLAKTGQTMIVVTHAMGFARNVAHTVHVMHAGKIAESGPPEQIFETPRNEVTSTFLAQTKAN
ncbi:MAG TPA: amino acid ABC transporter ATP-binding protein [Lacipirellulaceae bacterium]|jgi:ABC-type polar amino acid transport system ATPase subunit|nr:amino acid ABC transporter ATP-binding protein [Lacipirellulaceae bacterium]